MFQTFNEFLVKKQFEVPLAGSHNDLKKLATQKHGPIVSNSLLPKYGSLLGKNANINQPVQKTPAEFLKRGSGFAPTTSKRFTFQI